MQEIPSGQQYSLPAGFSVPWPTGRQRDGGYDQDKGKNQPFLALPMKTSQEKVSDLNDRLHVINALTSKSHSDHHGFADLCLA